MEEHIDLFKKILTKIDDKVDYADIRAGKGNNTSIIMKDNQIQEINTGLSTVAVGAMSLISPPARACARAARLRAAALPAARPRPSCSPGRPRASRT